MKSAINRRAIRKNFAKGHKEEQVNGRTNTTKEKVISNHPTKAGAGASPGRGVSTPVMQGLC